MITPVRGDGESAAFRVRFRGRRLKRWQRRHNSTHAKIRCFGEQAMATLQGWCLLRKLRCDTNRITAIVQAAPSFTTRQREIG